MSLSLPVLVAWAVARTGTMAPVPSVPPRALPADGVLPLEGPAAAREGPPTTTLPPDGVQPLAGTEPPASEREEVAVAMPLGTGPAPIVPPPLAPKTQRMVRLDAMLGPAFRIREVDTQLSTSVEYGRMHGLSATFHTAFLIVSARDFVRSFDVPLGVGLVARGRLGERPLYGSVGLTAGILVHRAATEQGVFVRVDPDFTLPVRVAWTAGRVGASLAFVPGYSVRERTYERRGVPVLERHSVRLALVLGLCWDILVGRAPARRPDRRRSGGR